MDPHLARRRGPGRVSGGQPGRAFLPGAQTVVGQHLCVRSNEGRWAYVHIAAIDTENDTVSFDITVWKLTTDP